MIDYKYESENHGWLTVCGYDAMSDEIVWVDVVHKMPLCVSLLENENAFFLNINRLSLY